MKRKKGPPRPLEWQREEVEVFSRPAHGGKEKGGYDSEKTKNHQASGRKRKRYRKICRAKLKAIECDESIKEI